MVYDALMGAKTSRGEPDDGVYAEQSSRPRRRQIVLAHMHAGSARHHSEIRPVVDDDGSIVGRRCSGDRVAEIEKGAGREFLGATLEASSSPVHKSTRQVHRSPSGAMCDVDVDDGV